MVPLQLIQSFQSSDLGRRPFYGDSLEHAVMGITPAQLNAGYYLVFPQHHLRLIVTGMFLRVNSAAIGAVTDIRIQTDEATPVVLATVLQANAGSGVKLNEAATNMALGAGFAVALNQGVGLKLAKTGSDATGAFTVDIILRLSAR